MVATVAADPVMFLNGACGYQLHNCILELEETLMFTKTKIILLWLAVVLFLTGCGGNMWQNGKKAKVVTSRSEVLLSHETPNNIVLMLPLKGEFAANSQAIRNGFLAAYYNSRKQRPEISIKVIDTTDDDVQTLYQQAVADGAEVIVGPLTKQEVVAVMGMNPLPVPTIALNTLDDYTHNFAPNLYQFGLLPQDEAIQVAVKMMQEQHNRAAIIVPENSWGNKIATAFKNKYESEGGRVVATLNYHSALNLSQQICPFLAQDPMKLCVPQKRKDKKQNASSESMRRQDINAIFLVATVAQARQIVPLLKFYYAGDLPIYSTSAVYTGTPNPALDQDIDGVYFCDMPWVLKDPGLFSEDLQAIHKQITTLWADSLVGYNRFYALGVDAYNLALGLNGFLSAPQSGVNGASGVLYLDDFNHIYRELQWAKMHNGAVVVAPRES
ncbi:MAG TPA: penicillin-binding protein activator [Coxiellaceae bacterium]|nr:MAG: hypothetical protein A2V89_04820 [Gammaproteobacteria bacterium RBG_16_37_9]HBY55299.1 penicillin-binding protein activator [Coxiellaceae bacterium]